MSLVLRKPWYSQPQSGARIDWGNPINRGLLGFLWIGPGGTRELVAAPWTILETGISRGGKPRGVAAVSAGGAADFIGSARLGAPAWKPTALPISYFAFFDHTTPAGTRALGGYNSGTNDGYVVIDAYATRNRTIRANIASTVYTVDPGTTWTVGESVRGLTLNATSLIGYDNGRSFGSTATAAGAITYEASFSRKMLLGYGIDGAGIAGHGYWEALWNRVLTPTEIAALSVNPWMMFEPLSRQIWVPSGGAPPAIYAPLGQFDPELRIAAWF